MIGPRQGEGIEEAESAPVHFPILGAGPEKEEQGPGRGRRWAAALLLAACALIPAVAAWLTAEAPRERRIHIEAYRYGFHPARILVNRGDRLRLTFSTRDTGQSFFLQDYDLHVFITPGESRVLVQRLSRPQDPPVAMREVELTAGLPGWKGWLTAKSVYRNHTYNGPLHGTERGDLVAAPNLLWNAAWGFLLGLPAAVWLVAPRTVGRRRERRYNLFSIFPWLKRTLKLPSFQVNLLLPMLAVFWFIILAGLLGTKVAGRNAGPMIIWVLWLSGLILVLVPLGGRVWCTVCPLPAMSEWMQRARLSRNPAEIEGRARLSVFGIPLVWPKWLSNAWPRVLLFLLLGTFSTTIVVLPPATSWMLIALIAMAVGASFFPDQRLFCRYLCPINSYISLYATTGRLAVRTVTQQACDNCKERFCLTGSVKGWGCPYGLCIADVDRNNDCGACMECVKTCAYDNVAVYWRSSGRDEQIADYGEAWQAMVMFALACLYCYINLGAWDAIRDWTDIVDKKNWGGFAAYAAAVWTACLGLLPLMWYLLARLGIRLGGVRVKTKPVFLATAGALIPIGMGCWMAFAIGTLLPMLTFVLQSLSDPFNWGWNLLGMAGSAWHIPLSEAIPAMQVACVLGGTCFALPALYRAWLRAAGDARRAAVATLPLGTLVWASAAGMAWFFAA